MTFLQTGMTREAAAKSLVDWLERLAEEFRDHVAHQREKVCAACAAEELIIHMRATDALKFAGRLDALATVIAALAREARS